MPKSVTYSCGGPVWDLCIIPLKQVVRVYSNLNRAVKTNACIDTNYGNVGQKTRIFNQAGVLKGDYGH